MKEKQTRALVLNPEQSKAVKTVVSKLGKESKPFLLEGVTGKREDGSLSADYSRSSK